MVMSYTTTSKYHLVYGVNHHNNFHRGNITNYMYKNGEQVDISDIRATPKLAFYKDGKVLNALSAARKALEKKEKFSKLFDSREDQQLGMADGL